jgi:hypothetical protein
MVRTAAIALAVALACTTGAAAQRAAARTNSGVWYAFGLAPGWASVSCSICGADHPVGVSAFVGLGGRTSRNLRIGTDLAGWRQRDGGITRSLLAIGAAAYWYPTARRRLYLKGGAAWVSHRTDDGTVVITSTGLGPQMGIGYEYPFGRKWVLAPFFHYSAGVILGDVKANAGQAADRATVTFFQAGVSLTRP